MTKVALGTHGEPLVNDYRLDKVFLHLSKLVKYPEGLGFATQLQEAVPATSPEDKGQPELAVFYITSPHPKAGKKNSEGKIIYPAEHKLVTITGMTYANWKTANDQFRHYAGMGDPLRSIFAGMLRMHLEKRKGYEDLID